MSNRYARRSCYRYCQNDSRNLCAFHGWFPICSGGGLMARHAHQTDLHLWPDDISQRRSSGGPAVYAFFTKVQLGESAAKCDVMPPIPQAKALAVRSKSVLSLGHA